MDTINLPVLNITKRKRKKAKKEPEIIEPKKEYTVKISFEKYILEI
jgi:hypothetical protein